MFSRGIRGISIDNNISAVAVKEKDIFSPSSLSRQLFSDDTPTAAIIATPSGEILIFTPSSRKTDLSKLTVCGVCMNATGAKIYKKLSDANINVMCMSLCDMFGGVATMLIAASAQALTGVMYYTYLRKMKIR